MTSAGFYKSLIGYTVIYIYHYIFFFKDDNTDIGK
jgi:hypothetical protein